MLTNQDTPAMLSFFRGFSCAFLLVLNSLFWVPILVVLAIIRLILPMAFAQRLLGQLCNLCANAWVCGNVAWMSALHPTEWQVELPSELSTRNWYLVISNHQSWVDIFVLQRCLHGRIPLLKFFIKQQLIWVPFLGLAWWALDFPFMKRYSKSYLEKHPEKKGQDLETTRKSCEKFQQIPTSVTNFLEGTRFTAIKHQQQSSPYKHLLKPKAGGMAFAMSVMGKQFDSVLDVTIHYPNGAPSFIGFLKGELAGCQVYIERLVINENLIDGDYQNDSQYRQDFQQWVDQIWQAKDARLDALKHRP